MDERRFIELASRYIAGAASAEEIEQLQKLLHDDRFAELFRKLNQTMLHAAKAGTQTEYDTERGLTRLAEKLRKHDPAFRWGPNRRRFPKPAFAGMYYGVAASIAFVVMLAGIAIYRADLSTQSALAAWNEKSTRMGEKLVIELPDRSTITLNADSRVKYFARFDAPTREVFLEGEAFFDVKHDPVHPFIVHTGAVSTVDLGTKFNISAFPADTTISVSLEEGMVQIALDRAGARNTGIVLSPSREYVFYKPSRTAVIHPFDPRKASGWKDGVFVFDNEPLSRVLVEMERAYGVGFECADTAQTRRIIKADFKNESVWTVAEILRKATGLSYRAVKEQQTLKKFIFSKN
jgi:transmembrane sensor